MAEESKTTPASLIKEMAKGSAEDLRYRKDIERARQEGVAEGALETRKQILSLIQEKFMDPNIGRNDPEGKALLAMAREISNEAYTR